MSALRSPAARWTLLLGAALAWRLVLFVGPQGSDDLAYSEQAHALVAGTFRPTPDVFALRLGYVAPMAGAYALFGAGPFTLVLLNLASSLVGLVLSHLLARRFLDDAGAWLSTCTLAVLPLDVFFATEAHTDLPVAVLTAGSVVVFLRAAASGRTALLLAAGLLLGAGHLMKESAFFGLAALAALPGRPQLRHLWVVVGFAAVPAGECLAYAAATGDPLFRVRAVQAWQTADIQALLSSGTGVWSRLGSALGTLFLPVGDGWPFFGVVPALALAAALLAIRRKDPSLRPVVLWSGAVLLLLLLWPITLWPYRPALRAHPRVFLLAAVPMAILSASLIRRLPRRWSAVLAGLLVLSAVGGSLVLHQDARRLTAGARLAFDRLPSALPVVSDPRTTGLFRLYDGYRDTRAWLDWERPPRTSHVRVVNPPWIALLQAWYGVRPPASFSTSPSPAFFEAEVPGRLRLRPLLRGRMEREPAIGVRLHRIDGGP